MNDNGIRLNSKDMANFGHISSTQIKLAEEYQYHIHKLSHVYIESNW